MKKILFAAALLFLGLGSANAQSTYSDGTQQTAEGLYVSKFTDNWYIAPKIGYNHPMDYDHMFPLNASLGVKFGKNFSPMFGFNFEIGTSFNDNGYRVDHTAHYQDPTQPNYGSIYRTKSTVHSHTFFTQVFFGLNGTINWTNIFSSYQENRKWEVGSELGVGWNQFCGDPVIVPADNSGDDDELMAKTAMTVQYNFGGASKPWSIFAEPAIYWNLTNGPGDAIHFNKTTASISLQFGMMYKFKTSNGTHNFKKLALNNDEINQLRAELAKKPKEVIKEVVKEVPVQTTETREFLLDNLYIVTYQQGKSVLTRDNKDQLDNIKAGSHVEIIGTASPEGPKELNERLSQSRADVVADYLEGRGIIVDRAVGRGVQGITSNRLAIVYVVKGPDAK